MTRGSGGMPRLAVRGRFALLAALLVLGVGIGVAAAGYFTLRHSLLRHEEGKAREQAAQLAALIDVAGDRGDASDQAANRVDISDPSLSHEFLRGGLLLGIEDGRGRTLQGSSGRALSLPSAVRARCLAFGSAAARLDRPPVAIACRRVAAADGRVLGIVAVGAPLRDAFDVLATLRRALVIALIVGAALAALLALLLAQRALRPARQIASAAESIRSGDLGHRIDYRGPPDELGRLADTLDACFAELEQAVLRQRRFVADASHELKTPIAAIRAHVDLLRRWAGVEPQAREQALRALDQAARTAARLVADLLYLARLDREPPAPRGPVRLDQVVLDTVREAAPLRGDVDIRLERLDEASVAGDELRLRQLLVNLLDNALRVSPPGREVEVALRTVDGSAAVSVSDRGPGIPPDDLDRIFDRFYSAGRAADRVPGVGAGLGLAIARSIAQAHGGSLTAANRPGGGATFTLTVPLSDSSANSHPPLTGLSSSAPSVAAYSSTQEVHMIKPIVRGAAIAGAVAGIAFGGVTLAQAGPSGSGAKGPESSVESTAPENSAKDGDNVQYTAPGDPDYKGQSAALRSGRHKKHGSRKGHRAGHGKARKAQDQGNGQSESSNETGGENESQRESALESEAGQPGEPANGHQDAPGQDANHDCTGNCVE